MWDESYEMSYLRWVVWVVGCVWNELCELWGVCEMSCVRWGVWDEVCEMRLCERSWRRRRRWRKGGEGRGSGIQSKKKKNNDVGNEIICGDDMWRWYLGQGSMALVICSAFFLCAKPWVKHNSYVQWKGRCRRTSFSTKTHNWFSSVRAESSENRM